MSSPELSEDDDSFERPKSFKKSSKPCTKVITISSDEDTEPYMTSDEDLPEVKIGSIDKKQEIIKNLFPTKKTVQPPLNLNQFKKSDKKVLPSRELKTPKVEPSTSTAVHKRMIGGVQVDFPVPPYGAQIALMSKVIEGMSKGLNCLLESPTGSGKTLALLCGALAWQRHERQKINDFQKQPQVPMKTDLFEDSTKQNVNPKAMFQKSTFGERSIYDQPSGSDADLLVGSKRQECDTDWEMDSPRKNLVSIHKKRRVNDMEYEPCSSPNKENVTSPFECDDEDDVEIKRVPTIFYGARTHKQIQQVVKEFSRTTYCGEAKMTVLSSRDYSCIRDFDRNIYKSKNDMCRECVKKSRVPKVSKLPDQSTNCKFYENRQQLNHKSLPPSFDLEELVTIGKDMAACPYYAARQMAISAHIVFCPYNYLIDPSIRNSMQIALRDEIVILDEAHNIEDICRDAATSTVTREQIIGAMKELEYHTGYAYANPDIRDDMLFLLKTLRNWDDWFVNQTPLLNNQPVNNGEAVLVWKVEHFVNTLNNHNIGQSQYNDFSSCSAIFLKKFREEPETLFGITQSTGTIIETINSIIHYLFSDNGKHMQDFKPALVRSMMECIDTSADTSGWRNSLFQKTVTKEVMSLRMMCMNPAVVFESLKRAKCIILSSGTLTPLLSLHSELDTKFPLQVSPNHVINRDRVWIGSLTTCPDGKPLECKSQSTNQPDTQDALGETVLWVSQVTPNGVLCFVPSYHLMNKLQKRWTETGLWNKLNEIKDVFLESRNVRDHSEIMDDYYNSAVSSRGALLFAVYRGKVSEGMDFKDEQARAVITVGIPYPNTFDMMVKEKMSYNERFSAKKQLLSSSEWLRVQAYRALNQAVGRCVRHRNDWGAVLLVDYRYAQPYYTEHLSKWVKNFLGSNHHTFESLVNSTNSLESFVQGMTLKDKEEDF